MMSSSFADIASFIGDSRSAWTVKQLSEAFAVSTTTIYDMVKDCRLPHYRVGGSVRFDPKEIADWWHYDRLQPKVVDTGASERYWSKPENRLKRILRNRVGHIVKGKVKTGSAVRDLGCTSVELKLYFESLFDPGMNWGNYGVRRGCWSIDHIMPLSSFDLQDRQHFLLACHYLNLRPMWHTENIQKGKRIPIHLLN